MKRIIQLIGLATFIIFSFFYTDKVMKVIREEDTIMIKINEVKDSLLKEAVDAEIRGEDIIPGINGRRVNVDRSYKIMRKIGTYRQESIVYDMVAPNISVSNHKDKYIVRGNRKRNYVSIVMVLNNDKYIKQLERILKSKNIIVNYFVDDDFLICHTTLIKEMENREFYSYGNKGVYSPDTLLFSNNLLSRITHNPANVCLTKIRRKETLNLCSRNNLYTVFPNIIVQNNPYDKVTKYLESGSIILLDVNEVTLREISIMIDYIKSRGYQIVGLSKMIGED